MNLYDFVWFQGVVEDIFDPEGLGRVRVRIFGIHNEDTGLLPTDKLPWASPLMPVTSASLNGIGTSPTGVTNGSWVIGFFRDGEYAQEPLIWGTVPGKPQKSNSDATVGFQDPDTIYPSEKGSLYGGSTVEESDLNRLATTNKLDETIHETKKNSTLGSAGSERIHNYHRSGSSQEYQTNGDVTQRTVGSSFEVVHGDYDMHVGGNCNYIVEGNLNIKVGDKIEYSISGTFEVLGGSTVTILAPTIHQNP